MAQDQHDTIIGSQVVLTGNLSTNGKIYVFGTVEGEIRCEDAVIIGEGASVRGPVQARAVELQGTITGTVTVRESIELGSKSTLTGDMTAANVVMKSGAVFNGSCSMITEKSTSRRQNTPTAE